jgi:hypothetical protein
MDVRAGRLATCASTRCSDIAATTNSHPSSLLSLVSPRLQRRTCCGHRKVSEGSSCMRPRVGTAAAARITRLAFSIALHQKSSSKPLRSFGVIGSTALYGALVRVRMHRVGYSARDAHGSVETCDFVHRIVDLQRSTYYRSLEFLIFINRSFWSTFTSRSIVCRILAWNGVVRWHRRRSR